MKQGEFKKKKYSLHPIWINEFQLVRYDVIFRDWGYENKCSFGIIAYETYPYYDISLIFTESEAREICEFLGWDFDKSAREVEDDE